MRLSKYYGFVRRGNTWGFLHADRVYIISKLNQKKEPLGSEGITQIFRGAEFNTVLCKGGSEVTRGLS